MVAIRITAMITIDDPFENIFMDLLVFICCIAGEVIVNNISAMIAFVFLVLFTSLFTNDAVYINSVIIPEEKVITRMNGIHLLVDVLYRGIVDMIDTTKMVTAREIGLIVFIPKYIDAVIIIIMFLFSLLIYKINVL